MPYLKSSRHFILRRVVHFFLIIIFSVPICGCATLRSTGVFSNRGGTRSEDVVRHTVTKSGETLSIISRQYTGSSKNWRIIASENSGIDPKRLSLGQKIRIPKNLIRVRARRAAGEANLKDELIREKLMDAVLEKTCEPIGIKQRAE